MQSGSVFKYFFVFFPFQVISCILLVELVIFHQLQELCVISMDKLDKDSKPFQSFVVINGLSENTTNHAQKMRITVQLDI